MRKPEVIGYRRDGRPMLWMENLEDGDSIVCDSRQLRRASAWLARQRLRNIVVADRAAVPCGRWVRQWRATTGEFWFAAASAVAGLPCGISPTVVTDAVSRVLRPRYRYEVRR